MGYKFELYGLYCPYTDNIKYVGITKNGLQRRLTRHLKHPTNQFITSWFNDLKTKNKKPIIRQIKENDIISPIRNLIKERLRSKINYTSIYREILYLVLVALERELIDLGECTIRNVLKLLVFNCIKIIF